jgi:hypothetical protein
MAEWPMNAELEIMQKEEVKGKKKRGKAIPVTDRRGP